MQPDWSWVVLQCCVRATQTFWQRHSLAVVHACKCPMQHRTAQVDMPKRNQLVGAGILCAGREHVQPAVKEVAGKVEPATKDITQGVIRPGGELISDRAVPVTEEFANKRFQPAVEQVLWTQLGMPGRLLGCLIGRHPSHCVNKRVVSVGIMRQLSSGL